FPASDAPVSSANPTWPANHIVFPPSVMTAGEKEYFASQDGSRIVFFSGIVISLCWRSSPLSLHCETAVVLPNLLRLIEIRTRQTETWVRNIREGPFPSFEEGKRSSRTSLPNFKLSRYHRPVALIVPSGLEYTTRNPREVLCIVCRARLLSLLFICRRLL